MGPVSGHRPNEGEVAADTRQKTLEIYGLRDVIVGTSLDRSLLVMPRTERGDHDYAHVLPVRRMLFHRATNIPATTAWHHDIEENERRTSLIEECQGLVTIVGDKHAVAVRLEQIAHDSGIIVVVIYHQYGRR